MLMKKKSTIFYSYNALNRPMANKQKAKYRKVLADEKLLSQYLNTATVKAPESVCKAILDYACNVSGK
jgi:hypothetical protein